MRGRLLLFAALASVLNPGLTTNVDFAQADSTPGSVVWWNTGDSFAAGEGATGASGYCQQSPRAFGPKAVEILVEQRSWTIPSPVFSACTSHTAMDQQLSKKYQRENSVRPTCKSPTSEIETRPNGAVPADDQSLEDWARTQGGWPSDGRFDVITTSFGGNDICFSDVIIGCMSLLSNVEPTDSWSTTAHKIPSTRRCNVTRQQLFDRVDALFAGGIPQLTPETPGPESLQNLWMRLADVHLNDDGVLIVVGYPRLMTPSDDWGPWRNNKCNLITAADADDIGDATEYLDSKMLAAVTAADAGRGRIRYVSRLSLFDAGGTYHSLCGRTVEWINTTGVFLRDGSDGLRYQRGFHPNDLGNTATAEAVAGVVAQVQEENAAPPTTVAEVPRPTDATPMTPAPIESGDQDFEIGAEFSAQCVIAWPTAPYRGVTSIQMRTSCSGVPAQFLFVDIIYDDPDLPVTPSRSSMRVHGEVVDISRSEYGFTVLVVYADQIELL